MKHLHAHRASTCRLASRAVILITIMLSLFLTLAVEPAPASAVPQSAEPRPQAALTLTSSTPVVSASSGYHIKVTIANKSDHVLKAGLLRAATNTYYNFVSRTDLNDWARAQNTIPTSNELGRADVPEIPVNGTTTVSVDANADQTTLKALQTWGPKPVRIDYFIGHDPIALDRTASLRTFLTRSKDGLNTADTPPMQATVVMPFTDISWRLDGKAVDALMSGDKGIQASEALRNGGEATDEQTRSTLNDVQKLVENHPKLQVVTDPSYAKTLKLVPKSSGVMQPGNFDITAFSAHGNPEDYNAAGVSPSMWNSEAATAQYRTAVGDASASPSAYAWQGDSTWTLNALSRAREQGYTTAIAQSGIEDNGDGAIHSDIYSVPTPAGEITLVAAQRDLTQLSQGNPSDKSAAAEQSEAGRISRLLAQSAFYQMEQPYSNRNVLICLSPSRTADENGTIMSSLEQATWLSLTDLDSLTKAEAYASGEQAAALLPKSAEMSQQHTKQLAQNLESLKSSAADIERFRSSVLDAPASPTGGLGSNEERQADSNGKKKNDDPQSLARQDAKETANRAKNSGTWMNAVTSLHNELAFHALCAHIHQPEKTDEKGPTARSDAAAAKTESAEHLTDDARGLADRLFQSVRISQSEPLTVVSETASMPVNVTNDLPYPVQVKVSSLTDSMEIVTSRFEEVAVPAKGTSQTTFTVRVSTSGTATAHMNLLDRSGVVFSSPQSTKITSTLRISDVTGWLFIAFALLLAVVGLWRQFHVTKDSDQ